MDIPNLTLWMICVNKSCPETAALRLYADQYEFQSKVRKVLDRPFPKNPLLFPKIMRPLKQPVSRYQKLDRTFSPSFKTETYKRSLSNFNTSVKNSQAQGKASFKIITKDSF
jgi:hypothetical protein